MGDAFESEPQGAFGNFLDWIGHTAQIGMNVARGRPGAALRHGLDFVGDAVDAVLPGDWIPKATNPEDYTSGADLLGIDRAEHPFLGFGADIGVGTALDPLTWVMPGASEANAGKTALRAGVPFTKMGVEIPGTAGALGNIGDQIAKYSKAGYSKLPQKAQEFGNKIGTKLGEYGSSALKTARMTLDEPILSPEYDALMQQGFNAEGLMNNAGLEDVRRLTEMLPDQGLRQNALRVANNITETAPGVYDELLPGSNAPNPLLDIIPSDAGDPLSDIARSQPAEDYLRINKPKMIRPVDPLDTALGIEQQPDILDQAYPKKPRDPRFASGIDVTNANFAPGVADVKTFGPKPLRPSPSEIPRDPTGPELVQLGQLANADRVPLTTLDQYGGAVDRVPSPVRVDVPQNAFDANMKGKPQEMTSVNANDIPLDATVDTPEGHLARYSQRIDALPISQPEKETLKKFWAEALPHIQEQYTRDVQNGVMFRPQGQDVVKSMPADYVHRRFSGMTDEGNLIKPGAANAIQERSIPGGKPLAEFMNKNPKIKLDQDIGSALGHRVEQDARMLKSQTIGKGLIDKFAKQADEKIFNAKGDVSKIGLTPAESDALLARGKALADAEFRTATTSIIEEIKKALPDTDDAAMLQLAVDGMAPRWAAMKYIAKANNYFKPAAVMGAFVPKIGSDVRNAITGIAQVAGNPVTRHLTGQAIKQFPSVLFGAINDGIEKLTGFRLGTNEFAELDQATKAAKGDPQRLLNGIKDPMMREAVQNGVIDNGFVNSEMMVKESNRLGWQKWLVNAMNWPAALFKGVEQRMRYGLYKGLRQTTAMSPEEAAAATGGTMYSYKIRTPENRLARDLVPFAQFQIKAGVQTAKLMAEQPSVAVALSQALGSQNGPLYPWMQGRTNIPLGRDEQGNDQYATGLGLPFEALNMIPTTPREFKKSIVGSSSPILKTALAATFNSDPYFETPYGQYDKIPGIGAAGDAGKFYNKLAGTGFIQPIDSLLRTIGGLTDERHSLGTKALDMLTGVNIASVDPDLALQKQLQELLANNPDVQQYRSFYDQSKDPETQKVLEQYKEAKVKAKRK